MLEIKTRSQYTRVGLALILCYPLLSACDTFSDGGGSLNPFAETVTYNCPEARVLADAESVTRYRPGSRKDILDLQFKSTIVIAKYTCEWDLDPETRAGTLTIKLVPGFRTIRGPAFDGSEFSVEYFATLTTEKRDILAKSRFDVRANIPVDRQTVEVRDREVVISTPVAGNQRDINFIIFTGFQLTRDELQYNRAERSRELR